MNYALIKNGIVANTIAADAQFAALLAPEWDAVIEISGVQTGIGWGWDGQKFIHPPEPQTPDVPAPSQTCTPAQGLIALYALKGITEAQLHAAISNIADEAERYVVQIGFSRATEWQRSSQAMQALAQLLGLSEADIDALYAYAHKVQV